MPTGAQHPKRPEADRPRTVHAVFLGIFFLALFWSGISPEDRLTWALEAAPGVLGAIVLILTFKRFQFTTLTYALILAECIVLFIGAKYTYAKVPLFDRLQEWLELSRNNYDKLGHFMQGFVPALIAREIILRLQVVVKRHWADFFVICICLAISAFYELLEWWVAEAIGEDAQAFLGMQGYIWDTQSDMFFALAGACCMLLFLSRPHNRAMRRSGFITEEDRP